MYMRMRVRVHVCRRAYLCRMLNAPTTAHNAAVYLSVVSVTESAQAARSGCTVAVLRLVLVVAALRTTGAVVTAENIGASGLGSPAGVRTVLKQAIDCGYLVRPLGRGSIILTDSGRILVSEMARAWERAVRLLRAFSPVVPYSAVQRAKDKKRAKRAKRADSRREAANNDIAAPADGGQ